MRNRTHLRSIARTGRAFTLIELLIVISIIAILAGLVLTVNGAATRSRIKARARTELALLQMAIEDYKSKLGHYPPDNPGLPSTNQLYFELLGSTNTGNGFVTLDGSARVALSQFPTVFGNGVSGFVNCSGKGGGDEARVARRFLGDLKPANIGSLGGIPDVKFLLCSITWPYPNPGLAPQSANPFRYNSSNPVNNPNSYDLWVDVIISGKTNRISNWSRDPIIVW